MQDKVWKEAKTIPTISVCMTEEGSIVINDKATKAQLLKVIEVISGELEWWMKAARSRSVR